MALGCLQPCVAPVAKQGLDRRSPTSRLRRRECDRIKYSAKYLLRSWDRLFRLSSESSHSVGMPIGDKWIELGHSKTGEPVFISQHGHDGQGGESLGATRYFCWLISAFFMDSLPGQWQESLIEGRSCLLYRFKAYVRCRNLSTYSVCLLKRSAISPSLSIFFFRRLSFISKS